MNLSLSRRNVVMLGALIVLALAGWYAWQRWHEAGPGDGFVSGNGRLEATEVDVATRLAGKVVEVLPQEGDLVEAGQTLARMQVDSLQAQRAEAQAGLSEARQSLAAAQAQVAQQQGGLAAQQAVVAQRQAEVVAVQRRFARSETLAAAGATPQQELDDDRANARSAEAALVAARAQAAALEAAVAAARAQVTGAEARVRASEATIARIDVDLADSELKAPREGRVQFRLAEPGEVLAAGGRVLNLVDLSDVYMTFFVPEAVAGRVALGSEVRIVLDAAPQYAIPARVSFVASTAQFTPKTVETANERQKLMFRVRAQIAPELLRRYRDQVKAGVPGVAWLRLDPQVPWPPELSRLIAE